MKRRSLLQTATAAAIALGAMTGTAAAAQGVPLKLHQILPPPATGPKHILKLWAERIEAAAEPVTDLWIAGMEGKGIDGAALIEQAPGR